MGISPSSVTPHTELTGPDLAWTERELPQKERTKHVHGIVSFPGKFIPQLVEVLLRRYFSGDGMVYDPFCGSGTTLVEGAALGIPSLGMDLMHFSAVVTSAKVFDYSDLAAVDTRLNAVLARTDYWIDHASQLDEGFIRVPASDWMQRWYSARALTELRAYRMALNPVPITDESYRLGQVILARAARSARRVPHYALDSAREPVTGPYYCHKHKRECYPTASALPFLKRYTADALRRVKEFQPLRKVGAERCFVVSGLDASKLDPTVVIDHLPPLQGILTSPPYIGNLDYHEQHRYFYEFFPDYTVHTAGEIGAASAGTSAAAVAKYIQDMVVALGTACKRLREGAPVIIVANDTRTIYPQIRDQIGLREETVLRRPVTRRTGLRTTPYEESVFVWRVTRESQERFQGAQTTPPAEPGQPVGRFRIGC